MTEKALSIMVMGVIAFFCLAAYVATGSERRGPEHRTVTLRFFWGEGCPHCSTAKPFLQELQTRYPELKIEAYEVFRNKKSRDLFLKMAKASGKKVTGVPTFFIGNDMITGFSEDIGREIEEKVRSCIAQGGCDAGTGRAPPGQPGKETINAPFLGKISPASLSLPVFTIVVAGLDSFNPCAFFVLFFLLSLLLHTHSRKKMLLVGGTFVLFSGLIYFLFMMAWLTIFLLLGNLPVITIVAGSVALLVSVINIKDFFFFNKGISLVIPEKSKPKLFERMRNLLRKDSLPAMLTGTVVLAVFANSYELLCTAGFPMIFTRALSLRHLSQPEYYLYLTFYNLIYIIPLLVIVLVFVITLGSRKLTLWQGRVLKLVSGLMMLGLGLVLLITPSLLNNALTSATLLAIVVAAAALIVYLVKKIRPDMAAD
jgi:thiol-disulfide isomerase/thioredoxin